MNNNTCSANPVPRCAPCCGPYATFKEACLAACSNHPPSPIRRFQLVSIHP